jgi:hypothetical protein
MESLPPRPLPPDPAECCGNGCSPCVWDTHAEALAEWERLVAARERAAETGALAPAPLPSRP